MNELRDIVTGETVDDDARFSLQELCDLCGVTVESVIEWVDHGVLLPEGGQPTTWRFSSRMLIRSRKAQRLRRDLELNLPGLALCLELLDELEVLRLEVQILRNRGGLARPGPDR